MRICLAAVCALIAMPFVCASASAAPGPPTPPVLQLPDNVVPLRYDVRLKIDPDSDTYTGTVDITVRIVVPTDVIWINATSLTIGSVRGMAGDASAASAKAGELQGELVAGNDDFTGLKFAQPLPAGEAHLVLQFTSKFNEAEIAGLFRQKEAGDWYVLTQFEPMSARRAFPCFDEPRFRATWRVVLTVPDGQRAFSNMPVDAERAAAPGWREVSFRTTPPIASYLVAMAVGPWDVLDGGTAGKNATPLRFITPKGRASEAAYAASVTPKILERLEAYFGQPFPFPKLDAISIPNTGYFFGAMENIGLITYDQRILLAKPGADGIRFQQGYLATAAHEMSHQWFGNLVTPAWWNDIWLNESFASWLGDKITAEVKPEWHWEYRRVGTRQWAIANDRLASARRIRQPIAVRSDVRSAFDGISYAKGATVLAMFEDWLGAEKFRAGVRRYMEKHAWSVATADDFFAALAADDPAVLPALRGFVDRPGVPLLAIGLDCAKSPRLTFAQSRFLPKGSTADAQQRWTFPACFQHGDAKSAKTQCTLVREDTRELKLDAPSCPKWVAANPAGIGYFLPAMSPSLYAQLPLAGEVLEPLDWFALLTDTNSLARSAAIPLPDALSLAAYAAQHSTAQQVFGEAVAIAAGVPPSLTQKAQQPLYAAWVRRTFGERAQTLGWQPEPGEDADTQRLRRTLVPLVAYRGADAALATDARARAMRWPADPAAVPPGIRNELLLTAARTAGTDAPALYAHFVATAKATKDAGERRDLLNAIGGFGDAQIARNARELMLSGPFDAIEAVQILAGQFDDDATRLDALAWLNRNYDALYARGAHDAFDRFPGWADTGCSVGEQKLFGETFRQRMEKVDGGPRSYAKALERIDLCIAYRNAQEPALAAWLKKGARAR